MAPSIDVVPPTSNIVPTKGQNGHAQPVDRVKQNELKELDYAASMGAPDIYIDSDTDTLWYNWTGSIMVKPLRFENRSGLFVIVLKTKPHANLGKHRHRGEVRAYTVKGNWGYKEYKWIAKPGDYIAETPGTIHTLWMGEGSEVVFHVMGSIESFNSNDTLRETMDIFSFWRMYVEHCEQHGIEPNKNLWY